MKVSKLAALALIGAAAIGGVATAQQFPPVEQGYVAYHYNQEFEPRQLVATSGQNCDGSFYHDPLVEGQYIEYVYFDC